MLGFVLLFLNISLYALVPVEGLLLGVADEDYQHDPLKYIYSDNRFQESGTQDKIKRFAELYRDGESLKASCQVLKGASYAGPWPEKQAQRSVMASLQYLGLDTTIKAIGSYAKNLEIEKDSYQLLVQNLVGNYCSKNITVFSLKTIEASLMHYFKHPQSDLIPSILTDSKVQDDIKKKTENRLTRSREFERVIKNFRAFCSWGGDPQDLRLLAPYINHPVIMAFVFKNLSSANNTRAKTQSPGKSFQVVCNDLICRAVSSKDFLDKFPLSVGSTGVETDLSKMYCSKLRFSTLSSSSVPQINAWIKSSELEDPILETSQFIALISGVPDFFNSVETYSEIVSFTKSSIENFWENWVNHSLDSFASDLFFEEPLRIRPISKSSPTQLKWEEMSFNFNVTLGELDRALISLDKIKLSFYLKISKNYLRYLKRSRFQLQNDLEYSSLEKQRLEVSQLLSVQLREKEKKFIHQMWTSQFSLILADELLRQVGTENSDSMNSLKDEMIKIPVNFSYGVFALHYLAQKANLSKE